MTTETAGIREIDAGALPDRYARGWHCLGPVQDYLDGKNVFEIVERDDRRPARAVSMYEKCAALRQDTASNDLSEIQPPRIEDYRTGHWVKNQ